MTAQFFGLNNHDNSLSFCRALEALMRGLNIKFYIAGEPFTSTPGRPRKENEKEKYKCPYSFEEQVEIIRRLHPDVELSGELEFLRPAVKSWRISAMRAMSFTGTLSQFGGWFKEALAVACISKRCYKLVRSIIVNRKSTHQKVNRTLFRNLPGVRDELFLYSVLKQLDEETISAVQFNKIMYDEKVSLRENVRPSGGEDLVDENRRLKIELEKMRKKCQELEVKVQQLEQEKNATNVYAFEDLDDVTTSPRPRRQAVYRHIFEENDESDEIHDDSLEDPHYNPADNDESAEMLSGSPPDTVFDRSGRSLMNKAFIMEKIESWQPMQPTDEADATVSLPVINICEDSLKTVMTGRPEKVTPENGKAGNETGITEVEVTTESKENNMEEDSKKTDDNRNERRIRRRTKSSSFAVGEKVLALFKYAGKDGPTKWYKATIQNSILNGLRYSVRFDDGIVRIVKGSEIQSS
ncbi:uncharacterized protein LOC132749533 isoform X2 [Ruditapes philippinarum]|nr:uncharacterized protein LOC132749533 isoform X2 [Ruditapes philippinarum]